MEHPCIPAVSHVQIRAIYGTALFLAIVLTAVTNYFTGNNIYGNTWVYQ